AVAPVVVRLSDMFVNVRPGKEEEVNIAIESQTFAGPVTVTLLMDKLPFGVTVDPSQIRLERGGINGADVFTVKADANASGDGSLGFRGSVANKPEIPVQFVPETLPVSVPMAGSVLLAVIGSLPVEQGEPASFSVTAEAVQYSGTVQVQVANAPGPVT